MDNSSLQSSQFLSDLYVFNDTEMAHKYDVHRKTIWRRRQEAGIPNPHVEGITTRPVFDLPEFETADTDELWELAEKLRQKIVQEEYRIDRCDISLIDQTPILLVWLADWHIGHISTDLGKLKHDLEIINETKGVYVIFGGDYTENTNTSRAQRGTYHEQLLPIRIQKKLAERAADIVGDKILAMVRGNHDAWSEQSDDFDFVEYMAKNFGVPYLGDTGFLDITLGSQEYTGLVSHKGKGGGKDKTAGAKNLMDLMGDADFVFTGHKHESAISESVVRNKPVVFGSAGSYMETGRFARGIPVPASVAAMPGVILLPHRKGIHLVRDFANELWMLEGAKHFA